MSTPSGLQRENIAGIVRIPMMPTGVEHFGSSLMRRNAGAVRIPMMPTGVEHKVEGEFGYEASLSAYSDDADRR